MIALERGNKQDKPKLNMAEKCGISTTILIDRGRSDQPPKFDVVTTLIFQVKRTF